MHVLLAALSLCGLERCLVLVGYMGVPVHAAGVRMLGGCRQQHVLVHRQVRCSRKTGRYAVHRICKWFAAASQLWLGAVAPAHA
jgi:hypothetical protein